MVISLSLCSIHKFSRLLNSILKSVFVYVPLGFYEKEFWLNIGHYNEIEFSYRFSRSLNLILDDNFRVDHLGFRQSEILITVLKWCSINEHLKLLNSTLINPIT